jgi:hypothetical protein
MKSLLAILMGSWVLGLGFRADAQQRVPTPPMPLVTVTTNADTNVVFEAAWNAVSGATNYSLSMFAFGGATNIFYTPGTNVFVTNPPVATDYGFFDADENASGKWSTNSLNAYFGAPNHWQQTILTMSATELTNWQVLLTNLVLSSTNESFPGQVFQMEDIYTNWISYP